MIFTYRVTENIPLLQIFGHFSYIELTYSEKTGEYQSIHAYFSDNVEVMMELEGINLMFSNQKVMPVPREYMKETKNKAKNGKLK